MKPTRREREAKAKACGLGRQQGEGARASGLLERKSRTPPWVSDFRADGACPPRTLHRLGPRARKPSQTQETEVVGVSKTVASALDDLNAKWEPTRAESSTQYVLSLAAILADLHCADIVKGTKLSIQTDINVFQDLAVALQQWELSEYSEELSGFYRSSFAGIKLVQQRLERYQKMDGLLYSVLTHLLDLYELKGHGYGRLLPQRHAILKSVPVLLFLLHCQNGKFLEKKGVARAVSLLKKNPVLPVVGDCWMSSLGLLSSTSSRPHELKAKHLQSTEMTTSVCAYAEQIRPAYDSVLFELCKCVSEAQRVGLDANVVPDSLAADAMAAYRKALDLAHECQWRLQSFYYWKLSSGGMHTQGSGLSGSQADDNLGNRIVGLFTAEEKLAILSLVQVLKDLNQYVQTREYLLFPILSAAIQKSLDEFQAGTVEKIALSKRCPDSFGLLLGVLRAHLSKRGERSGKLALGGGPSLSQLVLLNEVAGEMCYEIDNKQRKTKIFKKEVPGSEILRSLQSFALDSALFVHLLDQGFSLGQCLDTSYLWLHEHLFDKMVANKSAISTSLPWKLFEAQIDAARQEPKFASEKLVTISEDALEKAKQIFDDPPEGDGEGNVLQDKTNVAGAANDSKGVGDLFQMKTNVAATIVG